MTKFKGTKGKWTIEQSEHIGCTRVSFGDFKGHIELWHHHGDSATKEEAIANAILISKAPEMLEMLKSILASEHLKGTVEESKIKQLIKEATEL